MTVVLVVRVVASVAVMAGEMAGVEVIAETFSNISADARDEASRREQLGGGFAGVARSSSPVSVIFLPFSSQTGHHQALGHGCQWQISPDLSEG